MWSDMQQGLNAWTANEVLSYETRVDCSNTGAFRETEQSFGDRVNTVCV